MEPTEEIIRSVVMEDVLPTLGHDRRQHHVPEEEGVAYLGHAARNPAKRLPAQVEQEGGAEACDCLRGIESRIDDAVKRTLKFALGCLKT